MPLPDLMAQAQLDSNLAQERYQNAMNSGVDEKTAASLYLEPMLAKWQIIKSNPDQFKDSDVLGKITSDFEGAQQSAAQTLFRGGQTPTQIGMTSREWAGMPKADTIYQQLAKLRLQRLQNPKATTPAILKAEKEAAYKWYLKVLDPETGSSPEDKIAAKQMLDSIDAGPVAATAATATLGGQPAAASSEITTTPLPATSTGNAAALLAPSSPLVPTMPAPEPFYDWLASKTAESAPAAEALARPVGKFFISGTGGKPDLTNYTDRAEADAAWALAHPKEMVKSTKKAASKAVEPEPDVEGINEAAQPEEVIRLTKDGKKAVFDAKTHKFLRYAE